MKTCCKCGESRPISLYRIDGTKKDGLYPRCKVCQVGWAKLVKVIRRKPCDQCGTSFTPRHNKGRYVRHCSRKCATEAGTWRGQSNPTWRGDGIGYSGAHMRVRAERGPASGHGCTDCGKPGTQWSVNREADGLRTENGMPYSTDPNDYVARCTSCHKLYDLALVTQHGT